MKFFYKAKKKTAETVTGHISAQSQSEAIELIHQLGLIPMEVDADSSDITANQAKGIKKIKAKELYFFTRQLANLLKSGLSLLRALTLIEEQIINKYFRSVIGHIAEEVKNGKNFSDALSAFSHIFSEMYLSMVKAGEESGDLYSTLIRLSEHQKKQRELISKVRASLAYPLFMAFVGFFTVYYVIAFVFPKMVVLFQNIDPMPLPTLLMMDISQFMSDGWLWILSGITIVIFSLRFWMQSKFGRILSSRFILSLPLIGQMILKSELARFSSTLVLLMKSGISLIKALDIVVPILSNESLKKYFIDAKAHLISGGSLGESIKGVKEFPPMMGYLISVGEESDSLEDVFSEISDSYQEDVEEKIKILTALFEPAMILFIGLIIGFIVFAMLLPIFQMDMIMQ